MKNHGNAGTLIAVFLIGLVALVLLAAIGLLGRTKAGVKKVVALSNAADAAWADVENALKPRFDLIPGLIEVARGYAANDQELFTRTADAQKEYASVGTVEAAGRLEGCLAQLLALQDRYPQLQSNETFRALTTALAGTEPALSAARTRYNDAVRALDDYTKTPFGRRLAQKAGVPPKPYFQPPAPVLTQD